MKYPHAFSHPPVQTTGVAERETWAPALLLRLRQAGAQVAQEHHEAVFLGGHEWLPRALGSSGACRAADRLSEVQVLALGQAEAQLGTYQGCCGGAGGPGAAAAGAWRTENLTRSYSVPFIETMRT